MHGFLLYFILNYSFRYFPLPASQHARKIYFTLCECLRSLMFVSFLYTPVFSDNPRPTFGVNVEFAQENKVSFGMEKNP